MSPLLFPKDSVVVEVLEDVEPEEAVVKMCQECSQKGYRIALDDFFYKSELETPHCRGRYYKI